MKTFTKIKKTAIAAFVLAVTILLTIISGAGIAFAADSDLSTNVIYDLYSDRNFNADKYPQKANDNSLEIIQIAESTDGELLVYVYQPSGQAKGLRASSINISRFKNNTSEASFPNYKLEYQNSYDTLFKYKVVGFALNGGFQRIYNISNILRPFDKTIDTKPTGAGNTVSEVPYAVRQCWTATTKNGEVTYEMEYSEVIEIQNKYVGYVNYNDGVNVGWAVTSGATSAHFVAFSTDKPMDNLISASLTFNERDVEFKQCCNPTHFIGHKYTDKYGYNYGEKQAHEPNPLTLKYTDKASHNKYTWDRIQTTSEFLKDRGEDEITFTKEGTGGFNNTQWVLSFYETAIYKKVDGVWTPLITGVIGGGLIATLFSGEMEVRYTEVSEVMILQLEFQYEGKTYKLGAVDNKQTGADKPVGSTPVPPPTIDIPLLPGTSGSTDFFSKVWNWLTKYWWVIPVGIIGVVIVGFLLYVFAPLIGSGLKWLVRLPVRFVKRLFGGDDQEDDEEPEPKKLKKRSNNRR